MGEEFRGLALVSMLTVPAIIILQVAIAQWSIVEHKVLSSDSITQTSGKDHFSIADGIKLDTTRTGMYSTIFRTHNKYGADDVHFEVYHVSEIFFPKATTGTLWYGLRYSEISKRDQSDYKTLSERLQLLETNSSKNFDSLIHTLKITEVELNTQGSEYANFERAVENATNGVDHVMMILTDKEQRNAITFKLTATFIVFLITQMIWLLVCCFVRVNKYELASLSEINRNDWKKVIIENLGHSFEYVIPKEKYFLTPILINTNVLIFLLMYFGRADDHAKTVTWGSNYTPLVHQGQVWRLLSAGFIHFDFIHLMGNVVALGFGGYLLERVLGARRFGLLYIISIIGGSITTLCYNDVINAAGASGGVLGVLGAMLFYAILNIGDQDNRIMFVLVFAFFGFFTIITGFTSNSHVDNAGHIGGMITGMITGLFFIPTVRKADTI